MPFLHIVVRIKVKTTQSNHSELNTHQLSKFPVVIKQTSNNEDLALERSQPIMEHKKRKGHFLSGISQRNMPYRKEELETISGPQ